MIFTVNYKNKFYEVYIDDIDFERIKQFNWFLSKKGYIVRNIQINKKHKMQYLHRFLLNIIDSNKKIYLGSFYNKEDAAKAYNDAAIKYFGKFAKLNNIKEEK